LKHSVYILYTPVDYTISLSMCRPDWQWSSLAMVMFDCRKNSSHRRSTDGASTQT